MPYKIITTVNVVQDTRHPVLIFIPSGFLCHFFPGHPLPWLRGSVLDIYI